jgi:HD-GYP domain-containing protein (c-di-GMP phosphodiesterase class II)
MPLPTVIRMISDGAGTQFDPRIVDAFRRVMAQENAPITKKDMQPELQLS